MNPFRLNERLTLQKGIFVSAGDVGRTFMDNLQAMTGHAARENVLEFVIPHAAVEPSLHELFMMNITAATLFPGLDGFAESLGVNLKSIPPA